jgi:hypothetical protein
MTRLGLLLYVVDRPLSTGNPLPRNPSPRTIMRSRKLHFVKLRITLGAAVASDAAVALSGSDSGVK